MRVLELGSYVVPAYAGMILAEQGHQVTKWTSETTPDPVLGLNRGEDLWRWLNAGKTVFARHASAVKAVRYGVFDVVIDNIRAETWDRWGVSPAQQARRLGIPWVSMRDDFDGRSFDAVAQARAWGDHLGYLPVYLGDTSGGLWLAFKALSAVQEHRSRHHILRQAACLAKLVEGELVVPSDRSGDAPEWDAPGTYGRDGDGVRVTYRGEDVVEPFRSAAWRREHLAHTDGRYDI